jgi:hypothetical protein
VQQITVEFNLNNLLLIELHASANHRFVQAVISDGKHECTVKFRFDVQPVTPKTSPMVRTSFSRDTCANSLLYNNDLGYCPS